MDIIAIEMRLIPLSRNIDMHRMRLKLSRGHVLGEKGDDGFDAAFVRRERLTRVADKERIALDDALRAPLPARERKGRRQVRNLRVFPSHGFARQSAEIFQPVRSDAISTMKAFCPSTGPLRSLEN